MRSSCIPSWPSQNICHFIGQIFYIAWAPWGSVRVCFCDKCISVFDLVLSPEAGAWWYSVPAPVACLGLIQVFTRSRHITSDPTQTTKWGVDRRNIVLRGHQSSRLPPDKLRGLFVPPRYSDRVKSNHGQISSEKMWRLKFVNQCNRWVVESGVEVIGIWNRSQKVEPC